ncbi:MAG: aminotransferase class III-fold pyridoxal phosphate-dependent enzyme [Bacteriovoracaceae bacterium]|nr:aminotransferase class III-fold pyridoxal phosphate-dependent enzyme [Bacteriovoracaceae bacterium]
MTEKLTLDKSNELYEEALDLIPGAILGIRRPYNFVAGEYPIFLESAKDGRVKDVDGNEYIDMLCSYGPIIIGHRVEEIDNAVIDQMQNKGFCMSLTQQVQNKLAAKLREIIPSCEQSVFVKTGSDATTTAIRIARGYTKRSKVFRCGYHGWHDWCVEVKGGVLPKTYEDVHEFHYNDLASLEKLIQEHGTDTAAIIVTPIGHPLGFEVEMPKPGFLEGCKELAEKHGIVLIFDEIRSGFRVNMGGAQAEFGVTPHLSVFGKAMANGYPIGAVVGQRKIMNVIANEVFLSSTFFPNSLEQTAALKTIEIMERDDILGTIKKLGNYLEEKLQPVIANSPVSVTLSGCPWMPFITFNKDADKKYKKRRPAFYTELIRKKVFLQPFHHGYIAATHTYKDMDYVVKAIEESLIECAKI